MSDEATRAALAKVARARVTATDLMPVIIATSDGPSEALLVLAYLMSSVSVATMKPGAMPSTVRATLHEMLDITLDQVERAKVTIT